MAIVSEKEKTKESGVYVIFCLIQSMFGNDRISSEREYHLNEVFYNLQVLLQKYAHKTEEKVAKAFVYGTYNRLYTRQFHEASLEQIFYADSTIFAGEKQRLFDKYKSIGNANAAHLLLIADKMAKQYSKRHKDAKFFLCILSERQLTAEEVRQFQCTIGEEVPYQIVLIEKKKYEDTFEKYIENMKGRIYLFQEVIRNEHTISM